MSRRLLRGSRRAGEPATVSISNLAILIQTEIEIQASNAENSEYKHN